MGFARIAHKPVRSSPGIGIMPGSWTRQASRTHPAPLSSRGNLPSAPRCKLCASARIARLSCRRYAASSAALAAASSSAARISIKSRAGQCCSFRYPGIQGFRSLGQHRRWGGDRFLSFPCPGAAEAQRCQAAHAPSPVILSRIPEALGCSRIHFFPPQKFEPAWKRAAVGTNYRPMPQQGK